MVGYISYIKSILFRRIMRVIRMQKKSNAISTFKVQISELMQQEKSLSKVSSLRCLRPIFNLVFASVFQQMV